VSFLDGASWHGTVFLDGGRPGGPVKPRYCSRPPEKCGYALVGPTSLAGATPYGLSSGILSSDDLCALELASRITCRAIHINGKTVADEAVIPFGGTGASGNGSRMGGLANLDAYTETQWVTAQSEMATYPF
jgi:hypothetical protein